MALIAHLEEGLGVNGGTSSAIDTSGADLLVVALIYGGVTTPTLSDSKSNSWTPIEDGTDYGDTHTVLFVSDAPTVGSGHTFTATGSGIYSSVFVTAWSGMSDSALDQHTKNSIALDVSVSTGSVTPSEDNEVVVAVVGSNGTGFSVDGGFTANVINTNPGVSYGGGMGYLIQTTATAANPTWSWTTSSGANAVIATFKTSSGGARRFILGTH